MDSSNAALVDRYFELMNAGAVERAIDECLGEDVVQHEFPNRLLPAGATRDLNGLRDAAVRGRALIASQRFEVVSRTGEGNVVAVESIWTAEVGADVGAFRRGMTLKARFAQFFTIERGRIRSIRNYDCFEPW